MKLKEGFRGQVRVKAQGTQLSRFVSLLLARNILYQNAGYRADALYLDLCAKDYKLAVYCAKKSGTRLRIVSRRGGTLFLFRQRRRKWTLLILLPLLIGVGLLPQFVWTIELQGLSRISQMEMLSRLESVGITAGMWSGKLDTFRVKEELLMAYSDLSWLSLSLKGTTLTVAAEEATQPPKMIDRDTPCDIVADQTCVIYSIVTESGTPKVRKGDVVQEGDVLILGEVMLKDDDGNETRRAAHAAGDIFGRRTWKLTEEMDRSYKKLLWEDHSLYGLVLRWGDWKMEMKNPFRKTEQKVSLEENLLRLPFLPKFSLNGVTYMPYITAEAEYTDEEMRQRLRERLERQRAELLEEGESVVLEEALRFEQTDTGLRGIWELTVMQRVGKRLPRENYT